MLTFPSISTGIDGHQIERAAEVAVATVREALEARPPVVGVTFAYFSWSDLVVYQAVLDA